MAIRNQWLDYYESYDDDGNGLGDAIGKEYYFDITISQFNLDVASSTGIDPQDIDDGVENPPFNQAMYDAFNITIDQLEGEINLPYQYERTEEYQRIRVPHSLLGGFTQFRINYQYIYYPTDAYLDDITTEGFVHDGFIQTSRTIVPRGTVPTPPLPPPVFEIDEDQIKEALADKIYEKFFNSDIIVGGVSDIKSIQTTTSTDGVNYGTGRSSDDDQLIFFKKDRNTPENLKDFSGDGSNGIQAISNAISASLAGTDARGRVDLSDKLDDELSLNRVDVATRESSIDIEGFELGSVLDPSGNPTSTPIYFRGEIQYKLIYTINAVDGNENQINQIIEVPFAKQYQFFQFNEGDAKQQISNPNGVGTVDRPDEWANQLNISQLTLAKPGTKISSDKALTVLDTNIFELLPGGNQRQNEINNFFQRFFQLIGPKPTFTDEDGNGVLETIQDFDNQSNVRISSEDGRDDPTAFITRTNQEADQFNTNKTLQSMRDTLNEYLGDVDALVESVNEQRPEYENKSEGFLKIRRLNQSILIKSPIGESSFDNWEQDGFTITMWVRFLNTIGGGSLFTYGNPMTRTKSSFRLDTLTVKAGDTINYGGAEYTYKKSRRVVRLVVWDDKREDDHFMDLVEEDNFEFLSVPYERRMGVMYDSSAPYDLEPDIFEINQGDLDQRGFPKQPTVITQMPANLNVNSNSGRTPRDYNFLQYTDIPTDDLEDWFFICATYNPNVNEIGTFGNFGQSGWPINIYGKNNLKLTGGGQTTPVEYRSGASLNGYQFTNTNASLRDELIWLNHKTPLNGDLEITDQSFFGNRCKVEVISRSDLLRARGYRV